jgi:hypothetical protein
MLGTSSILDLGCNEEDVVRKIKSNKIKSNEIKITKYNHVLCNIEIIET